MFGIGKAKNFMMKKLVEKQLKDARAEEREMIMSRMEKDA